MLAHDAAYLSWRFLFSERDVDVPESQLSIFWEQQPRAETKRSSHREQKRQWEKTDQGEAGAVNEVNQIVEHAISGECAGKLHASVNLPARGCNEYNVAI